MRARPPPSVTALKVLLVRRPQVLAFSATYTDVLLAQLRQLMNSPQEVLLCPETVTLRGARPLPTESFLV